MDPIGIWTEGYGHAMRDSKGNFKGIANKALAYKSAKLN
jgi:lysozyme